ncbi:MAG TPA: hypothetical protein VN224_07030 [Xanthomonadales bacterium]|nr:hypothetical protein [Xanthomonadales bacterium]
MRRLSAILAFGLVLAAAGPARAQAVVPPPSWLGLTLEMPAAGVRDVFGDPMRVTKLPDALPAGQTPTGGVPERKARYVISVQPLLFAIVTERHGAVVGIEGYSPVALAAEVPAVTDPSGVALGATEAAVLKAHPDARRMSSTLGPVLVATISARYVVSYAFEGGRLNAIDWFARASTDPAGDGPPLAEPAGDSTATAVLIVAKSEDDGIRRQTMWMRFHPCDGATAWTKRQVATTNTAGRVYDEIRYLCPSNGATRTVFFDITSFFGKM